MINRSDKLVGLGCMRLTSESVVEAALNVGVNLLDTADVYGASDHENERLISFARDRAMLVTKGGLVRTAGQWLPDGCAVHLREACEASLAALGHIDLYLLHAVDPAVSLTTSVRALAALQREGLVGAIGLSNVNLSQLVEALSVAEISAVEVKLGPRSLDAFYGGLVRFALEHGIRVLAHSPFGGRARFDRAVQDVAAKHGCFPAEIVLAWLYDLQITPLPGATRIETARSAGVAASIALDGSDRAALDRAFGFDRALLSRASPVVATDGEIVLLMGIQGAGKSTLVQSWVDRGYVRLNRDLSGGSLKQLNRALDELLGSGVRRVVLDNTYPSRSQRGRVIEAARKHNLPVRCLYLETSLEDAQINAVRRLISRLGHLPAPEEIRSASKKDPNIFGPMVQFRYRREFEDPALDEGFSAIDRIAFSREPSAFENSAIIVEVDGVLRRSKSGARAPMRIEDVEIIPGAPEGLLLGTAWRPEISEGHLTEAAAQAIDAHTATLLGRPIEILTCPHGAGPPICWCRKPLPGLGVALIEKHRLDPARCLHVGRGPADRIWAARLGFQYSEVWASR